MTDAAILLQELRAQGMELRLDGDNLKLRGAADAALVGRIKTHKPALIDLLRAAAQPPRRVERGECVPANSVQRRLWLLGESGQAGAYAIASGLRLPDLADVAGVGEVVARVVGRHAALLARFVDDGGVLKQYVPAAAGEVAVERGDCSEADLAALLDTYAATAFDVGTGPLFRHGVYAIAEGGCAYLFGCHHIVADGRSLQLLFDAIVAALDGRPAPRTVPSFLDWAAHDATHGGARDAAGVDYARAKLAGADFSLRIAEESVDEADGALMFEFGRGRSAAVDRFARAQGTGRFAVLYALYKAVLYGLGGQSRVLVGHAVANRADAATHDIVGCFANTQVLRVDIDADESFARLAARVHAELLAAWPHQSAPLDAIVDALQPPRIDGENPLFDAFFALQQDTGRWQGCGFRAERLSRLPQQAKFALSLYVDQREDGDRLVWEYAGRALSRVATERLHERFLALTDAALAAPDVALARLDAVSARDAAFLRRIESAAAPAAPDLPALLLQRCRDHADQPAVIAGDGETTTYAQLEIHARAIAARLAPLDAHAPLVIALAPGAALATARLAALWQGRAVLTAPAGFSAESVALLVQRYGATAVVASTAGVVPAGSRFIDSASASDGIDALAAVAADAPAELLPDTTGTVTLSRAELARRVARERAAGCIADGARVLWSATLRSADESALFWATLAVGGSLQAVDDATVKQPDVLSAFVTARAIDIAWLPEAPVAQVLRASAWPSHVALCCAGERLAAQPGEAFAGRLLERYSSPVHGLIALARRSAAESVPAWSPAPGVRVDVIDAHARRCAAGMIGRLVVDTTVADRAQSTPQQGFWREDGRFVVVEHGDVRVDADGVRLDLARVERALAAMPGVAAVRCVLDGTDLVAEFARLPAADALDTVWRRIRSELPARLQPQRIGAWATWAQAVDAPATAATAATAQTEQRLAALWSEVLVLPRSAVQATSHFFHIAGNSLLAMRVLEKINKEFSTRLRFRDLVRAPVLAHFAVVVEAAQVAPAAPAPSLGPAAEATPLTPAQQLLWNLHHVGAQRARYNVHLALRLRGPLDAARLTAAIERVYRQQPALQSRFVDTAAGVRQLVAPDPQWRVECVSAAAEDVEPWLEREARREFNLRHENLFIARLIRLDDDDHVVQFNLPHLLVDGWSMDLIWQTVRADYSGHPVASTVASLPMPIDAAEFDADTGFWIALLRGHALPDLPRRSGGGTRCTLRGALEDNDTEHLERVAAHYGSTPFLVSLAIYALTLARFSAQSEFVISTPFANRDRAETAGTVAYCVSMLPLPLRVDAQQSFASLLQSLQALWTDAISHPQIDLDRLLRSLTGDHRGDNPLQRLVFAWQDGVGVAADLRDVSVDALELQPAGAKFPLLLTVARRRQGFVLNWEFDPDVVADYAVEALDRSYRALLRVLPAETALAELAPWTPPPLRAVSPIADVLTRWEASVQWHAARIALRLGARSLTYAELDRRSDRIAAALQQRGIVPADFVGLAVADGIDRACCILGIVKAGAAYVPLNAAWPAAQRESLLQRLALRLSLVDDTASGWPGGLSVATAGAAAAPLRRVLRRADSPIYVNFSSGTTGEPKAIVCADAGVVRLVTQQSFARFDAATVMLQTAPPDFDAYTLELWAPLLNGGSVVCLVDESLTPQGLRDAIAQAGVDTAWMTAALFNTLVDIDLDAFAGLRQLLVGGDVVSPRHVARVQAAYPAIALINGYGPTENTTFTACFPIPRDWPPTQALPIGVPIEGGDVRVCDAQGRALPPGFIGELVATGAGVALGYHAQPALSAQKFVDIVDGGRVVRGYRSGDLVYADRDGCLHFCGRRDSQVKINGRRVELDGIEHVLRSLDGVRDAACLVLDALQGQTLLGFVCGDDGLDEADVLAALALRVSDYQLPARLFVCDALPLTANGKRDRTQLREQARALLSGGIARALTPTEQALAALWQSQLGCAVDSPEANFFRLGGNSLLSLRLQVAIARQFGCTLPMATVLTHPRLADLAVCVEQAVAAVPVVALLPQTAAERLPLTREQARLWFLHRLAPSSAYNVPLLFELDAPPDAAALSQALRRLLERHAVLRLQIVEDDGEPYQRAGEAGDWALVHERLPEADWPARLERAAAVHFPLDRGMPFSALLLDGEERSALLLNLHHIAFDGHSLPLLLQELDALYRGEALPQPAYTFVDVVHWQQGSDYRRQSALALAYWTERLADAPCRTSLSGDEGGGHGAGSLRLPLAAASLDDVDTFCRAQGSSPFAFWFGVFAVALAVAERQDDLVIATAVANRSRSEFDGVIGFLANTLPLRAQVDTTQTFAGFCSGVFAQLGGDLAHQSCALDDLAAQLGVTPDPQRPPLSEVLFSAGEQAEFSLGATRLRLRPLVNAAAKYPLAVSLSRSGSDAAWVIEYDRATYSAARIGRFGALLQRVFEQVAATPALTLAALFEGALPRPVTERLSRDSNTSPSHSDTSGAASRALTPTEQALATLWQSQLSCAVDSPEANFFRLGGNSLLSLRLQVAIARQFGCTLPMATVLTHPRLADLAVCVEQAIAAVPVVALSPQAAAERLPLTREQARLWFLHRLAPSSAYNVPLLFELDAPPDAAALSQALRRLLERHAVLRLQIVEDDGEPYQRAAEAGDWTLVHERLPEADWPARLERAAAVHFPLDRGLPFNALLLDGEQRSALLLNLHHIAFDGHSLPLLLQDLDALYRGETLPLPAYTFADVVHWQQGDDYRRQSALALTYWTERLADAPRMTVLPGDADGTATGAGSLRLPLAASTLARADAFCRREGVSRFALWFGVLGLCLARVTQENDLIVVTPVANRARSEFDAVIGFLANTLALRVQLDETRSFAAHVGTVFNALGHDLAHQSCALDELAAQLGITPDPQQPPLSQVLFSAGAYAETALGERRLRPQAVGNDAAKYPLAISVSETAGEACWVIEYERARYSDFLIAQFGATLQYVLDQALALPSRPIAELTLTPAPLPPAVVTPRPFVSLVALIAAQCREQPRAIALHGAAPLRYEQLWQRASAFAAILSAHGVTPQSRVGILLQRSDDLPVVLLSVLIAGAAYVPLDPAYPAERLRYILDDARPQLVVSDTPALAEELALSCATLALSVLQSAPPQAPFAAAAVSPDDLAYLIYTSGSTGRPKGVAIRHESLVWLHRWAAGVYTAEDLRHVLAGTSICFDLSIFEIFVTWSLGGALSLAENALSLIDDPQCADVSLINTVPSVLDEVLDHNGLPATLRVVNLAGEALQRALVRRIAEAAPQVRVYNLYGPSEDTTYSTAAAIALEGDARIHIGYPLDGTRAYVLDAQRRLLPDGFPGELYLAGAGLAAGYFGQPQLTAERFVADPFGPGRMYRTGDQVRRRAGGELDYLGRLDHQCKLRGFRIELLEIERVLSAHAQVREVCVVVQQAGTPQAQLVAFVGRDGGDVDAAALKTWAARLLPTYMIPARVVFLDKLPQTASGKIDRKPLLDWPLPGDDDYEAPQGELETWLVRQFEGLLARTPLGARADFIDGGGDAALADALALRIEAELGLRASLRDIFDNPNPRALAVTLERLRTARDHAPNNSPLMI